MRGEKILLKIESKDDKFASLLATLYKDVLLTRTKFSLCSNVLFSIDSFLECMNCDCHLTKRSTTDGPEGNFPFRESRDFRIEFYK